MANATECSATVIRASYRYLSRNTLAYNIYALAYYVSSHEIGLSFCDIRENMLASLVVSHGLAETSLVSS